MKNFIYYNPVQIIFGPGSIQNLKKAADNFEGNILLVTGQKSIRESGVYERIIEILHNRDIIHLEGVKSNPELNKVRDGISVARSNDIRFILAAGGGSVIDTAKAISIGTHYDGDVWDFFAGKAKPSSALPLGTLLTIAATGSEMNPISVITNEELNEKVGIGHYQMYPQFSILDPELTMTVSKEYTAYSAVDIIAHSIEGYFTKSDDDTPIQNKLVFAVIGTVIDSMNALKDNAFDINARSNMMWASTIALNGILTAGIGKYSFENHMLAHSLSAFFNTPHGASLSIIIPAWLRQNRECLSKRIIILGNEVFRKKYADADIVINDIESYFKSLGAPVRLKEAGIDFISSKLIESVIEIANRRGIEIKEEYIKNIYEKAL